MGPKKGPTGCSRSRCRWRQELSGIAVEDIGKCVHGIFKERGQRRQDLRPRRRALTGAQMATALTKALGQTCATTQSRRSSSRFGSRVPRTWATCSSSMPSSRTTSPARAARRGSQAEPELQDFATFWRATPAAFLWVDRRSKRLERGRAGGDAGHRRRVTLAVR